jgi:hypothetical protein
LGKSKRHALVGPVGAPRQHHIEDSGGADQPRQAHRSAAAKENAAAAFRQRIIGRALSDPDMARGSEFEAAAHHRAMEHGQHRRPAELEALEGAMPGLRVRDPSRDVALGQLGQIEPGAEMLALAVDDDGFDAVGHGGEEVLNALNGGVVKRVALVGAREAQHANGLVPLEVKRRRKLVGSLRLGVGHRQMGSRVGQGPVGTSARRGQGPAI